MILPINTKIVLPLCHYEWGYSKLFYYAQLTIFGITIISQIINSIQDNNQNKISIGIFLLCCGYLLLCNAYNIIFLSLGTILIISGSLCYLKSLHKIYLWNDK